MMLEHKGERSQELSREDEASLKMEIDELPRYVDSDPIREADSYENRANHSNSNSNSDSGDLLQEFADHPIMDRVQDALYKQLSRTRERLKRDLLEETESLRRAKKQREDCGLTLYNFQQQLSRLQANLTESAINYAEILKNRESNESAVSSLREKYESRRDKVDELLRNASFSQKQLDSLQVTHRRVKKYSEDMKLEAAVKKRVAKKAENDVKNLEQNKLEQDLHIDGLHDQVRRLQTTIAILDKQHKLYTEESKVSKTMLHEIIDEIEIISLEKKQLTLQWKSSLVALTKRDEALAAAKKVLQKALTATKDATIESDGIKKDIEAEKSTCDSLVSLRNRIENETCFIDETLSRIREDLETSALQRELVEESLSKEIDKENQLKKEEKGIKREVEAVNRSTENLTKERHFIEESIDTLKYEQLAVSKSTKTAKAIDRNLLSKLHEKEIESAKIQNEYARIKYTRLNVEAKERLLRDKLKAAHIELDGKNCSIEKLEIDIKNRANEIGNKTRQVEYLNTQYDQMLKNREDPESLGPLEATIKSYENDIKKIENSIRNLQRSWLSDQERLVQIMSNVSSIQDEHGALYARASILQNKRVRLIKKINVNSSEMKSMINSIESTHNDKHRLNHLISTHSSMVNELENESSVQNMEFIRDIKDIEDAISDIEKRKDEIRKGKNNILSQLIDVETNILEWKKKIQLEKEARNTLINGGDANDIKGMQLEINRMKHRLDSLHKEQEHMIRTMEQAIYKREDIAVKYGYNGSRGKTITVAEIKRNVADLRANLKTIHHDKIKTNESIVYNEGKIEELKLALEKSSEESRDVGDCKHKIQEETSRLSFELYRIQTRMKRIQALINLYTDLGKHLNNSEKNLEASSTRFETFQKQFETIKKKIIGFRLSVGSRDGFVDRIDDLFSDIQDVV